MELVKKYAVLETTVEALIQNLGPRRSIYASHVGVFQTRDEFGLKARVDLHRPTRLIIQFLKLNL